MVLMQSSMGLKTSLHWRNYVSMEGDRAWRKASGRGCPQTIWASCRVHCSPPSIATETQQKCARFSFWRRPDQAQAVSSKRSGCPPLSSLSLSISALVYGMLGAGICRRGRMICLRWLYRSFVLRRDTSGGRLGTRGWNDVFSR